MLRPTEMMGRLAVLLQLDRARELTGREGACRICGLRGREDTERRSLAKDDEVALRFSEPDSEPAAMKSLLDHCFLSVFPQILASQIYLQSLLKLLLVLFPEKQL
jgi:hypothetical protein